MAVATPPVLDAAAEEEDEPSDELLELLEDEAEAEADFPCKERPTKCRSSA